MRGKASNTNKGNAKAYRKVMDGSEIKKLFNKLAKGKQNMSDDDLFEFLSNDLGIKADDPVAGYIVSNLMNVQKIQTTKYENLEALFQNVKAGSLKQLIEIIKQGELHNELSRPDTYKSMYRKLFKLYSGKFTTIDFEVAQMLWEVYLKDKLAFYNDFMTFTQKAEKKKIHQDLWNMMYDFSVQVKSLASYKAEDGWPLFIDEFVAYLRSK